MKNFANLTIAELTDLGYSTELIYAFHRILSSTGADLRETEMLRDDQGDALGFRIQISPREHLTLTSEINAVRCARCGEQIDFTGEGGHEFGDGSVVHAGCLTLEEISQI